jgi:hypothetical protein
LVVGCYNGVVNLYKYLIDVLLVQLLWVLLRLICIESKNSLHSVLRALG